MDEISDKHILIKYIKYLIDYADSVISQKVITENDYFNLMNESELFCKRISKSSFIVPKIKAELLNIRLPKVTREFSFQGVLRAFKRQSMYEDYQFDNDLEIRKRGNILNYKERMSNFLDLIIMKS